MKILLSIILVVLISQEVFSQQINTDLCQKGNKIWQFQSLTTIDYYGNINIDENLILVYSDRGEKSLTFRYPWGEEILKFFSCDGDNAMFSDKSKIQCYVDSQGNEFTCKFIFEKKSFVFESLFDSSTVELKIN